MKHKPLIIVLGEPYSTFSEIIFKYLKLQKLKSKRPIIFVGSLKLLEKQMYKLNYNTKFNIIEKNLSNIENFKKNQINIIDVKFNFKKIFDKISIKSSNYIKKCFDISLNLLNKKKCFALINGPISKKHFLKKKNLGITEYLTKKLKLKNSVMLIYNPKFSVVPVTTHYPVDKITKNLTKNSIIKKILILQNFYKSVLKKKPNFAILGLNPHCETVNKYSEEDKIIKPAIRYLLKNKVKIKGPFPADTFFNKYNLKKYDVCIGMYHDQVLTPMKTIYGFDAINITVGLPFIRVSPDHGTNNMMIGKNSSDPQSFISLINFFNKLNEN